MYYYNVNYDVEFDLKIAVPVILTAIGLSGNSWTLFIYTRPCFKNKSVFRYLIISIVSNTLVLISLWPYILFEIFIEYINRTSCKVIQYFGNLFYLYCPWILVVISIDHLFSIKFPNRYKFRRKLKFQAKLLTIIFIIITILTTPFYWYNDVEIILNRTLCSISDPYTQYLVSFSFAFLNLFIPLIIITLCMISICYHVHANKVALLQKRKYSRKVKHIKFMIAVDSFYFICNSPYWIQKMIIDKSASSSYSYYICFIANYFIYVQSSFCFFISYKFNKLFRRHTVFKQCSTNRILPRN